jgi:hypothetical protein
MFVTFQNGNGNIRAASKYTKNVMPDLIRPPVSSLDSPFKPENDRFLFFVAGLIIWNEKWP